MFIDWYTDKCIEIYFGLWELSAKKVQDKNYIPWLFILMNYDRKYGLYDRKSEFYKKVQRNIGYRLP